jgi:hypothetical protein
MDDLAAAERHVQQECTKHHPFDGARWRRQCPDESRQRVAQVLGIDLLALSRDSL